MRTIDLNADIGEGAGNDEQLLDIISSASIACGGHAGDEKTIRNTLRLAHSKGVVCGAHPSFADKENFGRLLLDLPISELEEQISEQLKVIQKIANEENIPLLYVKLHGALANLASSDFELAKAMFKIVKKHNDKMAILALDNSAQVDAAKNIGLKIIKEAYADRRYENNGLLVSRKQKTAVITDKKQVVEQCLLLAQKGNIITIDGAVLKSEASSICLHGDNANAVELAKNIHKSLKIAGIEICSAL